MRHGGHYRRPHGQSVAKQAAYGDILPDRELDSLSAAKQETSWRDRIAKNKSATLVAADDGDIWGWINRGASRDSDAGPTIGEVFAMYVSPERWRVGVGSALWQHAKNSLRQAGYWEVTLWVLERNDRARRFYEKVGFKHEPEIQKKLEREGETVVEVRYRHSLQAS